MKHVWIKSFTIDENGLFSKENVIALSPSLETKFLKLSGTDDKVINDTFIKVSFTNLKARIKYYKNPVSVDDKEYRMYKRSASSSREGSVLFIRSDLYEKMDRWSNCGIDLEEPENRDLVSHNFLAFQAYRALTLSGCEDFIHLNPKNILVIEDVFSEFSGMDKALTVSDIPPIGEVHNCADVEGKIYAYEQFDTPIKNCIWDGQGFLDESVFSTSQTENNCHKDKFKNKSMMILRNRFFKSCVFKTKLQKWFEFNGLVGTIQRDEKGMPTKLKGYTEAERYDEIQMVVTYSSLKYIRFFDDPLKAIKKWMHTVDGLFGIVKTDKPSPYFGGDYVRTNYQLLNTVFMEEDKVARFLEQNKRMFEKIQSSSKSFITFVECCSGHTEDILDEIDIQTDKFFDIPYETNDDYFDPKFEVCRQLVKLNSKFDSSSFYRHFIRKYVKGLCKNLEIGKVLVQGTYATIVSNPFEMLQYIVGRFDISQGKSLMKGEIYSPFFADGETILGSRSPHILPGNILVAENRRDNNIDAFFEFNRQIVCINSIGSLILHRLNGSDQDGDTILLTNNEILVEEAQRFNSRLLMKFTVPVNCISRAKRHGYIKKGRVNLERFAEADHNLSNNAIGEIVNLSQKYNSILWDTFIKEYQNDSEQMYRLHELYFYNAILEVLSNNEIDAAKGKTDFKSRPIVAFLRKKALSLHKNDPLFFVGIEEKKKQREVEKEPERKGKLAIGDESTTNLLWFERTTADLSALSFEGGSWAYRPCGKNFKRSRKELDLDIGKEITLLYTCKKHPNSYSLKSVLVSDESKLFDFESYIRRFADINEACEFNGYSEDELYLVKGCIRKFVQFNYDKYETTMDYVYENSSIRTPGGQGQAYMPLSEAYRPGSSKTPKNRNPGDVKMTDELIRRLITAENVRIALRKMLDLVKAKKDLSAIPDKDLTMLQDAGLNKSSTFSDYKQYLFSLSIFGDGINFFSSKDRIKQLIEKIDGSNRKKEGTWKAFYLALYLMLNDQKSKYRELFEIEERIITPEDVEKLLWC